jgi:hypothetical protein
MSAGVLAGDDVDDVAEGYTPWSFTPNEDVATTRISARMPDLWTSRDGIHLESSRGTCQYPRPVSVPHATSPNLCAIVARCE